jgi:NAD-dependent deacetylase
VQGRIKGKRRYYLDKYWEVAELIREKGNIIAFTGAGISVESGIPAFRGAQGLWEKYDPAEYAHIESFVREPAKIWTMLRAMTKLIFDARPSAAHLALAALEKAGFLNAVVTQNVDGLHQEAGNTNVIEYHGNSRYLICLKCHRKTSFTEESLTIMPYPACNTCHEPLKPDGVFFGEQIPASAIDKAHEAVQKCKIMIIIGTSGIVYPAAEIPFLAASRGATVVEINISPTPFTSAISRYFFEGSASQVLSRILSELGLQIV